MIATADAVEPVAHFWQGRGLGFPRSKADDGCIEKMNTKSHIRISNSGQSLLQRKFLKSSVVMETLGYTNRAAFWEFVRAEGVPHIRLNARRIMFEELALTDWIQRRSTG